MTPRPAKLATAAAFVALLAWPLAAAAAQPQRPHRPRCNDLRAIARFVHLSEQQIADTRAIFQGLRQTVEPLREQIPPLREELAALLDTEDPAAAEVGQIVIDIDSLGDQIQEAREAAEGEFEALLTEEQLARWEQFQQICRPGYEH
jgi:Spy/CpxP family protein refolding chaperone